MAISRYAIGRCFNPCFTASCDWSRTLCVSEKSFLATCPLFDAVAFASLAAAASAAPTNAAVYAIGGGPDGEGRCINATQRCRSPATVASAASEPLNLAEQWAYLPPFNGTTAAVGYRSNASSTAVEMWLRFDSAATPTEGSSYVILSSPTFGFEASWSNGTLRLTIRLSNSDSGGSSTSCSENFNILGWSGILPLRSITIPILFFLNI